MSEHSVSRCRAFYEVVAPHFSSFAPYDLIECCAGDGKGALAFSGSCASVTLVDVYEPSKLAGTISNLRVPVSVETSGVESFTGSGVFIGLHACGSLTDKVLSLAVSSRSPVAVMPCCYRREMALPAVRAPPDGRLLLYDRAFDYVDAVRCQWLREQGYRVVLERIDSRITPMNNVIVGVPQ